MVAGKGGLLTTDITVLCSSKKEICRGKLRTWVGVCKGQSVLDMVGRGGGPLTSVTTVLCSSITTFFRLSIRLATMVF